MSRSGYWENDGDDNWSYIRWQGASKSARRGKRGQAFFRDLLSALDAMPDKRLIVDSLQTEEGQVCALGALAVARGLPTDNLDPEDHDKIASTFNIAPVLARDVVFINDDDFEQYKDETDEQRFIRVRAWVVSNLIEQEKT